MWTPIELVIFPGWSGSPVHTPSGSAHVYEQCSYCMYENQYKAACALRISRKTYCFAFKRILVSSNFHSLVIFTHHRGCYKYIFLFTEMTFLLAAVHIFWTVNWLCFSFWDIASVGDIYIHFKSYSETHLFWSKFWSVSWVKMSAENVKVAVRVRPFISFEFIWSILLFLHSLG